jgi:hypothetical protein
MSQDSAAPWPSALIFDIAIEAHDVDELLIKYSLSKEELDRFYTIPQFRRELVSVKAELTSSGSTFRAHAKVLAESHLLTMNDIMNNPDASPALKHEVWKSLVEYAKLKPPKEAVDPASTGHNLTINIAGFAAAPPVAGPRPVPVIDVTPTPKVLSHA